MQSINLTGLTSAKNSRGGNRILVNDRALYKSHFVAGITWWITRHAMTLFFKSDSFTPLDRRISACLGHGPGDHLENAGSDERRGSPAIMVDGGIIATREAWMGQHLTGERCAKTQAKFAKSLTTLAGRNDPQLARSPVTGTESDAIVETWNGVFRTCFSGKPYSVEHLVSVLPRTNRCFFLHSCSTDDSTAGCSQDKFPQDQHIGHLILRC